MAPLFNPRLARSRLRPWKRPSLRTLASKRAQGWAGEDGSKSRRGQLSPPPYQVPAVTYRQPSSQCVGKEKELRIYVGNFGYETSEQELREAFEAHGQVQEVSMIQDRETGRPKGFAFVEMPTSAEAQAAIAALNGKEFDGRTATVNEARPRQERSSGGGSGPRW